MPDHGAHTAWVVVREGEGVQVNRGALGSGEQQQNQSQFEHRLIAGSITHNHTSRLPGETVCLLNLPLNEINT